MDEVFTFGLTGASDLAKLLEEQPPIVARGILRGSLIKAVQPWRELMAAKVRRGWHIFRRTKVTAREGRSAGVKGGAFSGQSREFGVISRNIRARAQMDSSGFEGSAAVYPAKGAFWAKFLEFKTRRMHQKFPFVVPAFEAGKNQVLGLFIDDVRDQLKKEMRLS